MLYGSERTQFLIRAAIGVAVVALGLALHQLVVFTVGLAVMAVAVQRWYHREN